MVVGMDVRMEVLSRCLSSGIVTTDLYRMKEAQALDYVRRLDYNASLMK